MAAPPALMIELVEEILLRIPPDDPASLVRAALACKRWCRLVASARFRRRLREIRRGRAAPLLGFLCDLSPRGGFLARFVPTTPSSFRPPRTDFPDLRAHDARHGRVLLHTYPYSRTPLAFLVWDPLTDGTWTAGRPRCSAPPSRPFVVVFVGSDGDEMFTYVYSSTRRRPGRGASRFSKSIPVTVSGGSAVLSQEMLSTSRFRRATGSSSMIWARGKFPWWSCRSSAPTKFFHPLSRSSSQLWRMAGWDSREWRSPDFAYGRGMERMWGGC